MSCHCIKESLCAWVREFAFVSTTITLTHLPVHSVRGVCCDHCSGGSKGAYWEHAGGSGFCGSFVWPGQECLWNGATSNPTPALTRTHCPSVPPHCRKKRWNCSGGAASVSMKWTCSVALRKDMYCVMKQFILTKEASVLKFNAQLNLQFFPVSRDMFGGFFFRFMLDLRG